MGPSIQDSVNTQPSPAILERAVRRRTVNLHQTGVVGFHELSHIKMESTVPALAQHLHKDRLEIIYVFSGIHHYFVAGDEYEVCGGEVIVFFPNEIHSSNRKVVEKSEFYSLILDTINNTGSFLGICDSQDASTLSYLLNHLRYRHFSVPQKCKSLLDELFILYEERPSLWRTKSCMLTFNVLNFVIDNERIDERILSPEIEKSIRYIENNLFEPLGLPHLADYVFLSLSYYKARFKHEVGLAPGEYVMRRKMRKACGLLLEGISITNTAHALCFSSAQHFSSVFKQYNGISPSQYLQQTTISQNENAADVLATTEDDF